MESSRKNSMAVYLTSSLLMALIVSTIALDQSQLEDITTTIQEMQRANYFTFVTLLNMVQDGMPSNTTFLMPSDRALSKASIPENKTLEFLLRHSIPSPLLFEDLSHFPTGTTVPTHQQDYMLKIVNRGRRGFHLNNVQLVSTDICTAGSSFRCHGIYGVLTEENSVAPPTCSQTSPTERAVGPSPTPSQPSPPPLVGHPSLAPTINPPPAEPNDGPQYVLIFSINRLGQAPARTVLQGWFDACRVLIATLCCIIFHCLHLRIQRPLMIVIKRVPAISDCH